MKDNNRTFGIEIEAYGVSRRALTTALSQAGINIQNEAYNHNTRSYWKIVNDGSIRGIDGFELVSPPLCGEAGLNEIRTVCRVLAQLGARVNKSCGLHVHHHAPDFKPRHFQNLVAFYTKAEDQIDRVMPNSRRASNNRYCGTMKRFNADRLFDNSRYHKLNLNSYYRYGTVEFRHHSGTIEADKIINWVELTQRMVLRAKKRVTAYNGHSLTWYDVKQALGLVHNPDNSDLRLARFYETRMAALA